MATHGGRIRQLSLAMAAHVSLKRAYFDLAARGGRIRQLSLVMPTPSMIELRGLESLTTALALKV